MINWNTSNYKPNDVINNNAINNETNKNSKSLKIEQLYKMKRKSKGTGYLLLFLFGGIGAHSIFIKDYASFVIYLIFFIIGIASSGIGFFITGLFLFVQLFTYSGQIDKYNEKVKLELELQYN